MIPKREMKKGYYLGHCRNAYIAYWTGKYFIHIRNKFGTFFIEQIDHFEDVSKDEDGFIPIEKIEKPNEKELAELKNEIGY